MHSEPKPSPLDELRILARELRQRWVANGSATDDAAAKQVFLRIDEAINAAQQRRDRSESIISSAWDAIITMDASGRILEWNQQAERIFGWSREEAVGRLVAETIIPAGLRAAHETGLRRFLKTGEAQVLNQRMEVVSLRRDGAEFPAELTILAPQRLGEAVVFTAFVRDITRRKQADESIASSESLYHSLVDRLPINVTRKDRAGRITFVNQPFCELVGRSATELLGKTDFEISPRELAEKYRRDDEHVAATCEVFHAVEENRFGDRVSYFEVWKIPVRDAAGQVVETQAVFWDVTEREENRTSLARERDLLRTLMDSLPDLIYVKDRDGRYVTVNRALQQLWNNPPLASIVGKTAFAFVRPELAAKYAAEDRDVLENDRAVIDCEELVITPTGEQRVFSASKVPLHDQFNQVTGLVGIDRDITHRKRTEVELLQARRAADAANQAKSDFLANMSHEIRTPLNAIIGITDLLLAEEQPARQREYLEIVRDSGESLMVVINDILDFSKIEAGQLQLDTHPFHLADAIGGSMKALALRAHAKHLELACDLDARLPEFVDGDSTRLRQVITNLIGNAIKFTTAGEVVLQVELIEETADQARVRFLARDTGIGIPAEKQRQVFDAFVQADASTTRRFGGTGLGLAISTRLVKAMGGSLEMRSDIGVGSEFFFSLTFPKIAAAMDQPLSTQGLAGRHVLIVDDNATNRRILIDMLRSFGMQVGAASGAVEALEMLTAAQRRGEPIELVLTDINMPDVDGFMLAERIRRQQSLPQPVLIVLTSGPRPTDEAHSEKLHIAAQLMKPIKRTELQRALCEAMPTNAPSGLASHSIASAKSAAAPIVARRLRILLVEDSRFNQILALGILEREGHDVAVASNGREAVAACESGHFDLILMDIEMPEMDGLQATAAIRRIEQTTTRHVPILAMTAHALADDRDRCLAAGMDGYLSKPIRMNELLRTICELTGGR